MILKFIRRYLLSDAVVVLLALGVVASMAFPWHESAPRIYPGLDPNLIFVNTKGSGQTDGTVRIVNNQSATMTAVGGSAPTIHLVDSESDFAADFDITPYAAGRPWESGNVTVQAPSGARYFVVLLGVVGGSVVFHDISVQPTGSAAQPTTANSFSDDFADLKLSNWQRSAGVQRIALGPHDGGLQVTSPGEAEVGTASRLIGPIGDSLHYVVHADFRIASGTPHFKVTVAWADAHRATIAYLPDWPDWAPYAIPEVPAIISLWHPRDRSAINIVFGATLQPRILLVTQSAVGASTTTDLGPYTAGVAYHIALSWTHGKSAQIRIRDPSGGVISSAIDRSSGLGIFKDPFVNLSIGASAPREAQTSVALANVVLTIPPETRFAINVADSHLDWLIVAVLAWLGLYFLFRFPSLRLAPPVGFLRQVSLPTALLWTALIAFTVIAICELYVGAALLDGHPFDRLTQESAAYVISQYGIDALYGRTSAIPDGIVRGGLVPWSPAEFAYPPGMVNFFIGVAESWEFVRGPIVPMGDRAFYTFWKFDFALFLIVCAALAVLIRRGIGGPSSRGDLLVIGLIVVNPAFIFDVPVWGESNGLLLALLLLGAHALVTNKPRAMWSALAVALLVKQTALLVIPFLGLFALRRYGLRKTLADGSFGTLVGFASVTPELGAGYSPATMYLPIFGKVSDFGSPLTSYDTTVAADTYPIWVLFTGFTNNLHGMDRLWASDRTPIGGIGISYADAGLLLFITLAFGAAYISWRSAAPGRRGSMQRLFLTVGLAIVGYVVLNTRTSGHYLILALPFLALGMPKSAPFVAYWKIAAISVVALLSEYGLFMFIAAKGEWPQFFGLGSPSTNSFSGIVYRVYTSDVVITLGAALMLIIVVRLLIDALEEPPRVAALGAPQSMSEASSLPEPIESLP